MSASALKYAESMMSESHKRPVPPSLMPKRYCSKAWRQCWAVELCAQSCGKVRCEQGGYQCFSNLSSWCTIALGRYQL